MNDFSPGTLVTCVDFGNPVWGLKAGENYLVGADQQGNGRWVWLERPPRVGWNGFPPHLFRLAGHVMLTPEFSLDDIERAQTLIEGMNR